MEGVKNVIDQVAILEALKHDKSGMVECAGKREKKMKT